MKNYETRKHTYSGQKKVGLKIMLKAEFTQPVSACVLHIALQFPITYPGFHQSRYVIKNCNRMWKMHAENVCGNWMCKQTLKSTLKISINIIMCIRGISKLIFSKFFIQS